MELVGIVLLCLLTWVECIAVEEVVDVEEGCTVHHLTGKVGESSSPSFLLSPLFPVAIRSPHQPWQDFSFAFKNSSEFPVGSLKVSRVGESTELSLAAVSKNINTLEQEQQLQILQLSQNETEHVSLSNWTFVSFRVLGDQLQVSVHDGLDKLVFREVNASDFRQVTAHVPSGHFLDVALGCTGRQLPKDNVGVVVATSTEPPGDDSRSRTPLVVVSLIVLGLILVVGTWYWRGRRRSRTPESETGGETEERSGMIEEGDAREGEERAEAREGEERAEARPLVDGSSVVVENETDSGSESESDTQRPHETQITTNSQNETNATGDATHRETQAAETSQNETETNMNPDSETMTTEDSPNEGETIQGTFFATQDEIKKSTHSIYEPE